MKKIQKVICVSTLVLFLMVGNLWSQKTYGDLYHPEANAAEDIETLVHQAKEEGKHVILQVGGNWCVWCYRFHDFVEQDTLLKPLVEERFLVYHLNYSKENKNEAILAQYRFPQRFGFPVFVVLDGDGQLLHTQDSALLESGDGYDAAKVKSFFEAWSAAALDPKMYESK